MTGPAEHPTPDEWEGILWWNSLTEAERGWWMHRTGSAVPAEAWKMFKAWRNFGTETPGDQTP